MEEVEIWKSLDFLGYPDYEVSTLGNVKSLNYRHTGKEKILKQMKHKNDYLHISLYRNGKHKNYDTHRLVALAFISNPNNLPQVNHKDENKQNNKVDNLEWVTSKYNNNYGTRNEKASKVQKGKPKSDEHKQKISEARRKPILQFTLDNIFIREWDSAKSASKELNIDSGFIAKCCKGKCKFAYGFLWKYKI